MKKGFFPRLAWGGIRRNGRVFFPYWLTCALCASMFYLMRALCGDPAIAGMREGGTMTTVLALGSVVIGAFSVIFLFYTNSFLIRRRKREFGLYCVLGMDRRSVGRILLWEALITYSVTLGAGLACGITVSKLGELLLVRMVGETADRGFYVSWSGVLLTFALFGAIFLLLLLNGIRQVRFSTVTGLLRSSQTGEKPPRANHVLAVLGALLLGAAYWMAVSIRQPVTAILLFFAAVLLVIAATYLLMISGSVTLCRTLQKNKKYYYRTAHFVSVSSMAYRMKRNGAGLAGICILSTMVLVMLSSTACLFFGSEDALNSRYPREIGLEATFDAPEGADGIRESLRAMIAEVLREEEIAAEDPVDFSYAEIAGMLEGRSAILDPEQGESDPLMYDKLVLFCFADIADSGLADEIPQKVREGALMVYSPRYPVQEGPLTLGDAAFEAVSAPDGFEFHSPSDVLAYPTVYLFASDLLQAVAPLAQLGNGYGERLLTLHWQYGFDTGASPERQEELAGRLAERYSADRERYEGARCTFASRAAERTDYYSSFGGFFFLGILLSVVFLSAAAIIIYYKQLSEGYEDMERFAIMRKVGMTRQDIRRSVNAQMRTVFFFPLGLAVAHLCFAFPMIRKMLVLFSVNDLKLLLLTAAVSTAAFAAFYMIVYRYTAGVYAKLALYGDA